MMVFAPRYEEVRSAPMSKPNHPERWYQQMMEQWADQQEHLTLGKRADGHPMGTPNGLTWNGMTITSSEVMPFCILGHRFYMIGLPGLRTYHIQVGDSTHELRANVPLDLGRYSILVFDEKVARIAFPIHGRMVYGHRIGELFTDIDGNVWEEVWRNAKQTHEEKETHVHGNSQQQEHQRIDHYYVRCSLGEVNANMVTKANGHTKVEVPADGKKGKKGKTVQTIVKNEDPREMWEFSFRITPYQKKEEEPEQKHFYYLEINFEGADAQLIANGEVVAESSDASQPLYVPTDPLHNLDLQLFLSPTETGDIDMKSIRLVECVHELVQ